MKLCNRYESETITVYTVREFNYDGEHFVVLENPMLYPQTMTFENFKKYVADNKDLELVF